jgi:hypothetical protein
MTKFIGNTITLPKLATAPSSPVDGDAYYNTTDNKVYARVNGAWVDLGATGGGGNTVYYQTSAPVSANTGDIWIDSDSVLGGPLTLTDSISSTSITTAATPNSVKSAYDIATAGWEAYTFGTAGVIATVPRFMLTASSSPVSGQIVHSRIIPHRDFVVTNIAFVSTSATSAPTLVRFGIYTRSGTTFTLVARTASDTTIFDTTQTKYTRALNTTGGYPATYTLTAGTEYFLSVIQVATTPATLLLGTARQSGAANAATGAQYYTDAGEADLSTPSTGSVSASFGGLYAEVS